MKVCLTAYGDWAAICPVRGMSVAGSALVLCVYDGTFGLAAQWTVLLVRHLELSNGRVSFAGRHLELAIGRESFAG